MANEEHLAILKQGVEAWNEWRADNPNEVIDLSKANLISTNLSSADLTHIILKGADLSSADLRDSNLHGANLYGTNLTYANLAGADLEAAILSKAVLKGATLQRANLSGAKLWRANLTGADLKYADFTGTNLEGADLSSANLSDASLTVASLQYVNLTGANLKGADFNGTNLWSANLTGADLEGANLLGTDLQEVNFEYANLINANLRAARAIYTNFRSTTLTGACIEDWHINADTNLSTVTCDYVYLKCSPSTQGFEERRPHTGTFAPGEFAKLIQSTLNTIDLIFREGLDWKAFAYSFKQVEVLHEDAHLEVRSIENKGDGVVIVKVAATPDANKALIHTEFMKGYEFASEEIAAQYEARLLEKGTEINRLFHLLQLMAEKAGDHYYGNIHAANFTPHGTATGGVYNDFSNTQDLAQAAAQIQALLAQLQQQGQSPEDAQQQVANDLAKQADQDHALLGKLVKWGQKLGDATVTDVVKGVVKMALRAAGVPLP